MSRIYNKFIKESTKGYTLRGGPFAKWRYPLNKVLYRKRLDAGPETERPRSAWSNWNYDSEIYAFGQRLQENFNPGLLRQAFIDPSYPLSQKKELEELDIQLNESLDNTELAIEGKKICENYIKALLKFWYTNLPDEQINKVSNYLMETEHLSKVARNIGIKDLIKSQEFPVENDTLESCLFAVISALNRSSGKIRAHLFVNDFIVIQLVGKNIIEILKIDNSMELLCEELKKKGQKEMPVPRLIWSTGATSPTASFIVGLYVNGNFFSRGFGETLDIAEEMSARDGLMRLYGITEDAAPLPFGDKARKFSENINNIYEKYNQS